MTNQHSSTNATPPMLTKNSAQPITHPLTDEIIVKLIGDINLFTCLTEDDMRAAADWQLEQVIKQWEDLMNSNKTDLQMIWEFDKRLKAMRPQQQEDN